MSYTNTLSPHNNDPASLLTIGLLHRLNRSMWVAIFPQKATMTVCLGFFINPSSMFVSLSLLISLWTNNRKVESFLFDPVGGWVTQR